MAKKKKAEEEATQAVAPQVDLNAYYPGIPTVVTQNTVDILKQYQPSIYEQYQLVIEGRLAQWNEAQEINSKELKVSPAVEAEGGETVVEEGPVVSVEKPITEETGGIVGVVAGQSLPEEEAQAEAAPKRGGPKPK